jgi:predicted enzyme involved in methoxymalonyl-ACP biosynthesis
MDKEITISELKNEIDNLTEYVQNLQMQIYILTMNPLINQLL